MLFLINGVEYVTFLEDIHKMHIIEFVEQFPITYINFNEISYICSEL